MSAQPHDVDVKALLRLATLYNVPTAINRSSADFLISSPLFEDDGYEPVVKDYKGLYRARAGSSGMNTAVTAASPCLAAVPRCQRSCDSGAGTVPERSKSPQRSAMKSSVE